MINNRHQEGAASEAIVRAYLTQKGYDVFMPTKTQSRVDFVYILDNKVIRVQVKSASFSTPSSKTKFVYEQSRLTKRENGVGYTRDEIDEVWIVRQLEDYEYRVEYERALVRSA